VAVPRMGARHSALSPESHPLLLPSPLTAHATLTDFPNMEPLESHKPAHANLCSIVCASIVCALIVCVRRTVLLLDTVLQIAHLMSLPKHRLLFSVLRHLYLSASLSPCRRR
jgi:hypothetical protein